MKHRSAMARLRMNRLVVLVFICPLRNRTASTREFPTVPSRKMTANPTQTSADSAFQVEKLDTESFIVHTVTRASSNVKGEARGGSRACSARKRLQQETDATQNPAPGWGALSIPNIYQTPSDTYATFTPPRKKGGTCPGVTGSTQKQKPREFSEFYKETHSASEQKSDLVSWHLSEQPEILSLLLLEYCTWSVTCWSCKTSALLPFDQHAPLWEFWNTAVKFTYFYQSCLFCLKFCLNFPSQYSVCACLSKQWR